MEESIVRVMIEKECERADFEKKISPFISNP